jgi:hypothetical protein
MAQSLAAKHDVKTVKPVGENPAFVNEDPTCQTMK